MHDAINHPSHYTDGKIEVIDYIEDKQLGYHLGNAIKYISRAGKKDPSKTVEDLKKAVWYINRKIKKLESGVDPIEQRIIADEQVEAEQRETLVSDISVREIETHKQLVERAKQKRIETCTQYTFCSDGCPLCYEAGKNKMSCGELTRQHPQLALDLMQGKVGE